MKRMLIFLLVLVALVALVVFVALPKIDELFPPGSKNRPDGTSLHIVNNSSETVCKVVATNVSGDNFSISTFERPEIAAGDGWYYKIDPGSYDLSAMNCNGDLLADEHNIEVVGSYIFAITD